jgi:hypothetical protein
MTLAKPASKDRQGRKEHHSAGFLCSFRRPFIRREMNRCEIVEVSGVELDRALKKGL